MAPSSEQPKPRKPQKPVEYDPLPLQEIAAMGAFSFVFIAWITYSNWRKRQLSAKIHVLTQKTDKSKPPNRSPVFVETDIKGSTTLYNLSGTAMEEAQRLHDSLIRSLITRHHGYEITTEGDAFKLAFHDTSDAVMFALDVQTAMMQQDWPEDICRLDPAKTVIEEGTGAVLFKGLRVRIGIHAATQDAANTAAPNSHTTTRRTVYTGPAVIRAHAIGDCGHGGQVVLSGEAWNNIKNNLERVGSPVVTDLGVYRLHVHDTDNYQTQLVQLLPSSLANRSFYAIRSDGQLGPGMADAPGSDGTYFNNGGVCFVFTYVEFVEKLVMMNRRETQRAVDSFTSLARKHLALFGGYECQEDQGQFMMAFHNSQNALMYCVAIQNALMNVKWRRFILNVPGLENVYHYNQGDRITVFRGLKVKMGIELGVPVKIVPHSSTGRADYFGNIINLTARIAKAAHGGQVVMGEAAWRDLTSQGDRILQGESSSPGSDRVDSPGPRRSFAGQEFRSLIGVGDESARDLKSGMLSQSMPTTDTVGYQDRTSVQDNAIEDLQVCLDNVQFDALGTYRLRGMIQPMRLVQALPKSLCNRTFPDLNAEKCEAGKSIVGESLIQASIREQRNSQAMTESADAWMKECEAMIAGTPRRSRTSSFEHSPVNSTLGSLCTDSMESVNTGSHPSSVQSGASASGSHSPVPASAQQSTPASTEASRQSSAQASPCVDKPPPPLGRRLTVDTNVRFKHHDNQPKSAHILGPHSMQASSSSRQVVMKSRRNSYIEEALLQHRNTTDLLAQNIGSRGGRWSQRKKAWFDNNDELPEGSPPAPAATIPPASSQLQKPDSDGLTSGETSIASSVSSSGSGQRKYKGSRSLRSSMERPKTISLTQARPARSARHSMARNRGDSSGSMSPGAESLTPTSSFASIRDLRAVTPEPQDTQQTKFNGIIGVVGPGDNENAESLELVTEMNFYSLRFDNSGIESSYLNSLHHSVKIECASRLLLELFYVITSMIVCFLILRAKFTLKWADNTRLLGYSCCAMMTATTAFCTLLLKTTLCCSVQSIIVIQHLLHGSSLFATVAGFQQSPHTCSAEVSFGERCDTGPIMPMLCAMYVILSGLKLSSVHGLPFVASCCVTMSLCAVFSLSTMFHVHGDTTALINSLTWISVFVVLYNNYSVCRHRRGAYVWMLKLQEEASAAAMRADAASQRRRTAPRTTSTSEKLVKLMLRHSGISQNSSGEENDETNTSSIIDSSIQKIMDVIDDERTGALQTLLGDIVCDMVDGRQRLQQQSGRTAVLDETLDKVDNEETRDALVALGMMESTVEDVDSIATPRDAKSIGSRRRQSQAIVQVALRTRSSEDTSQPNSGSRASCEEISAALDAVDNCKLDAPAGITDTDSAHLFVAAAVKQGVLGVLHVRSDDLLVFARLLQELTSDELPFHNSMQTAGSMTMANYVLTKMNRLLSVWQRFGLLLASMCRNVGHPGRSNANMVQNNSRLAVQYNDGAVAEKHAVATTFKAASDTGVFCMTPKRVLASVRKATIQLLVPPRQQQPLALVRQVTRLVDASAEVDDSQVMSCCFNMVLHAHCTREWSVCKKWLDLLSEELSADGSPVDDMQQVALFDMFYGPLFALASSLLNSSQHLAWGVNDNRNRWASTIGPGLPQRIHESTCEHAVGIAI